MHIDSSKPLIPRQLPSGEAPHSAQATSDPAASSHGSRARDLYQPTDLARAGEGPDRLELSSAARDLGVASARGAEESPTARSERVAGLMRDLAEGRLFSPERLRLAASRLLGGH